MIHIQDRLVYRIEYKRKNVTKLEMMMMVLNKKYCFSTFALINNNN